MILGRGYETWAFFLGRRNPSEEKVQFCRFDPWSLAHSRSCIAPCRFPSRPHCHGVRGQKCPPPKGPRSLPWTASVERTRNTVTLCSCSVTSGKYRNKGIVVGRSLSRRVLRLSSHESAPSYFHVRIFKLERSGLRQTQAETQNVTAPGVSDTRETVVLSMFICGLATRVQARGQTDCKPARSPLRHAN